MVRTPKREVMLGLLGGPGYVSGYKEFEPGHMQRFCNGLRGPVCDVSVSVGVGNPNNWSLLAPI